MTDADRLEAAGLCLALRYLSERCRVKAPMEPRTQKDEGTVVTMRLTVRGF